MRSTIHEIRNQLAVAVANIEAFMDGKFKPTGERLSSVLAALLEVDVLINDLPDEGVARSHTTLETVNVCDVIANELTAIEPAAAAMNVDLRIVRCTLTSGECAAFTCDPGQVRQIVKNLMLNAVKFAGAGGTIAVDCHHEPGTMALSVSDDGPGVLPEEREAIFENGFRGSAASASIGSGMGLAVVKRIVDAHGGTVDVDRSAIGGARFAVRLPGSGATRTCVRCLQIM